MPLSNDVLMTGDGRAVLKHHPDNQVLIEYSQRLGRLAMGENRSKVLREISAASNLKSMKAMEQEDVVAVSARFSMMTKERRLTMFLGHWVKLLTCAMEPE